MVGNAYPNWMLFPYLRKVLNVFKEVKALQNYYIQWSIVAEQPLLTWNLKWHLYIIIPTTLSLQKYPTFSKTETLANVQPKKKQNSKPVIFYWWLNYVPVFVPAIPPR